MWDITIHPLWESDALVGTLAPHDRVALIPFSHPRTHSAVTRYCPLWAHRPSHFCFRQLRSSFPVGHPSWDCSHIIMLNLEVPIPSEAAEPPKGLVLDWRNNDILKLKLFGTSLFGAAFSWYSRLKPGSIADWPTMETLLRETYDTIKLEEAIKLVIRGLEYRQQLKHHRERFTSMGDLINKIGSYELILNEMDEKANASKGTYVPRRNRTVRALNLQSPMYDPYYQRQEETKATQEYDDVGAVELTGKPLAHKLKNLKITREPITIQSFAWTKPE
ncbi:hypothetical protein ACLB2K_029129 [Fragaria x ananassa]